jgi:hypothetical protein
MRGFFVWEAQMFEAQIVIRRRNARALTEDAAATLRLLDKLQAARNPERARRRRAGSQH